MAASTEALVILFKSVQFSGQVKSPAVFLLVLVLTLQCVGSQGSVPEQGRGLGGDRSQDQC